MKALVLLAALLTLAACSTNNLPSYGVLDDFTLTDETGAEFSSKQLEGKIWVADFFFTTCNGPCPRMSTQMNQVQNAVRKYDDVRLVSFTIDPKNDTPQALAAYARRYKADAGRWHFLTGPMATLHHLSREKFMLGNVDGTLEHSTRFVLVDRKGRIRGYYQTAEKESIPQLIDDIGKLRKERL